MCNFDIVPKEHINDNLVELVYHVKDTMILYVNQVNIIPIDELPEVSIAMVYPAYSTNSLLVDCELVNLSKVGLVLMLTETTTSSLSTGKFSSPSELITINSGEALFTILAEPHS